MLPAPRPPIPWDLTPSQEKEEFARLKSRLARLWVEVFPRDDVAYTSVIVPSISVAPETLRRRAGALFYEETLLFLLIRLRNPRARTVYVTSEPISRPVLEYYLQFLAGIPVSHAAARLTLLAAYDHSARPLTEKILERPRLVERIRAAIPDLDRAYLTVLRSTPLERRLAVLLGIPLNAADPGMDSLCSRSGARRVLRESGVEVPQGVEDIQDEGDVVNALLELRARRPGLRRALLKTGSGPWSQGTAVFTYPERTDAASLRRALSRLLLADPAETPEAFFESLGRVGAVAEEFLEGEVRAASGQVRVNPRGETILTSDARSRRTIAGGSRFRRRAFASPEPLPRAVWSAGSPSSSWSSPTEKVFDCSGARSTSASGARLTPCSPCASYPAGPWIRPPASSTPRAAVPASTGSPTTSARRPTADCRRSTSSSS
jgi:hypothetical protein